MWCRWKAGQSLHEIGRAFGKEHSSIRCLVSRNGGFVPAVRRRSLRVLTAVEREENLVDVTGIEPVTPCLQRLVARRINKLHQVRWNATDCYKCIHRRWLSGLIHYSVAISRVRWWAQNWAQPPGVRKG
jgi:hypothetical protein